jgi:hypothetical protein
MNQLSNRWKSSAKLLLHPNVERMRTIELQRFRCGAPRWRCADNPDTVHREMVAPLVSARIEDRDFHSCLHVVDCFSGRLSQRTGHTRKRKVLYRRGTARRLWNDMVDVKAGFLGELRDEAVFATIVGSINNGLAQQVRNRHEFTQRGSTVLNASEGEREDRLAARGLRLRDARHLSAFDRNPACPAGRGDDVRPLAAGVAASIRQEFRAPIELFVTYPVTLPFFSIKSRQL